jgi:hypothetical protein
MAGAAGVAQFNLLHVMLFMVLDIGVQLVVALGAVQLLHGTGLMPENRLLADHHIAVTVWCRGSASGQNGNNEQKQNFFAKHHMLPPLSNFVNLSNLVSSGDKILLKSYKFGQCVCTLSRLFVALGTIAFY